MIRSEVNEKEMKETIAKISKTKTWFFEKINKFGPVYYFQEGHVLYHHFNQLARLILGRLGNMLKIGHYNFFLFRRT